MSWNTELRMHSKHGIIWALQKKAFWALLCNIFRYSELLCFWKLSLAAVALLCDGYLSTIHRNKSSVKSLVQCNAIRAEKSTVVIQCQCNLHTGNRADKNKSSSHFSDNFRSGYSTYIQQGTKVAFHIMSFKQNQQFLQRRMKCYTCESINK